MIQKRHFILCLLTTLNLIAPTYLKTELTIEHYTDRIFMTENPPLIVFWTQKAGCTTVLNALVQSCGLEEEASHYPTVHHYFWNKRYWEQNFTAEKFYSKDYYKVKFVRNPYIRAVSSYIHIIKYKLAVLSFESFLELLEKKDWNSFSPITAIQHGIRTHTQPQSCPFDQYMNIIQIEKPTKQLQKLQRKTGISIDLTIAHKTKYLLDYIYYVGDLLFNIEKQYPPFYAFYSEKTLALVEKIYQQDIESFNYEVPKEITLFLKTQNHNRPFEIGDFWSQ